MDSSTLAKARLPVIYGELGAQLSSESSIVCQRFESLRQHLFARPQ